MAPTTWTTPEEAAFLQSKTSSYSEAQKDGNFIPFWATLYEQWEEKFSTFDKLFGNRDPAELTADEQSTFASALKAKRQQLRTWFRWRAGAKTRSGGIDAIFDDLFEGSSRSRTLSRPEVYSKLFYESKLKPLVESQLDSTLTRGSLLAARNQIIKQLWEAETDPDVKAQVEAQFEGPKPGAEATPSQQSSDKYA
ncbi:hypothetical protein H0H92_014900, partial [Tricholoma furcatifolium]